MKLNLDQVDEFNNRGLLFVESLFNPDEIRALNSRLPDILNERGAKVLRERNSDSVRSAIAPHLNDDLFKRLSLHPRLVMPARQLLDGDVYLHQFKINAKEAHNGEIWHWHQDYRTWYEDDGMPEPKVINATVFLNDVNEFNGPMMFIPGSHKDGRLDADQEFERVPEYGRLSADAVGSPYKIETINALIEQNGIVAPKGPAGSTIFFHGCTIHGSAPNMSPWSRAMVFSSLNKLGNYIRKPTRPDFLALQEFAPLVPLHDNCLLVS
ncbi:MAG: proline hydroxylase [Rhodospirillaceae bacterium]|nr:proline hydroxylase [Rhodospirillaceae bacterium]|tara:strand:+ start:2066 stop:2866 length:801 start_codon:yes stop_codon:yes gene_type:complete